MIGTEYQQDKDLAKLSVEHMLRRRGGLVKLLLRVYPYHQWHQEKFSRRQKKSSQWLLYKILRQVLPPNVKVVEEYLLSSATFSKTGCPIILDVYIPSLNLAFEYHGYQHYFDHFIFGYVKARKDRDIERFGVCESFGLTYIEVPYWWQGDEESITEVLHKYRPDLIKAATTGTAFLYEPKQRKAYIQVASVYPTLLHEVDCPE